jgi:Ni,Fe-hydrogenase maturation factor
MTILLIACGNSLRQDDGAGLILGQRLADVWRAKGVPLRFKSVQQLMPELAIDIAADDVEAVWFVDTRVADTDADIQIRRLESGDDSPAMGHQMSPEVLLLYARFLFDGRLVEEQPIAWQITIPGFEFDHSEMLSARCQAVLDGALDVLSGCSRLKPRLRTSWTEVV